MPRGEISAGSPLARVRSLCLALPGTEQRESHRGWVGVYRDVDDIDWPHVEALVEDAWRSVAPKRLLAEYDAT